MLGIELGTGRTAYRFQHHGGGRRSQSMDQIAQEIQPGAGEELPMRLHHHAYTTDDHKQNNSSTRGCPRLPLVAIWGRETLEAAGSNWARVGWVTAAVASRWQPRSRPRCGRRTVDLLSSMSFLVEQSTQDRIRSRMTESDPAFCPRSWILRFPLCEGSERAVARVHGRSRKGSEIAVEWRPRT